MVVDQSSLLEKRKATARFVDREGLDERSNGIIYLPPIPFR